MVALGEFSLFDAVSNALLSGTIWSSPNLPRLIIMEFVGFERQPMLDDLVASHWYQFHSPASWRRRSFITLAVGLRRIASDSQPTEEAVQFDLFAYRMVYFCLRHL